MTTLNITFPMFAPVAGRIAAARATVADRMQKRKVYVNTLRELQALSNRDLADLGLARSGLGAIAWEAAYGK